jgi:hypothetical protein
MAGDATKIVIENIDELCDITHKCTAQETLTRIQVEQGKYGENLTHLAVCFEQVAAQLQEQNKNLMAFIDTSNERVRMLESAINKQHLCSKDQQIISLAADVTNIKMTLAAMHGESKWIDRAVNILQAVLIAVVVLLATWFMRGGAIT